MKKLFSFLTITTFLFTIFVNTQAYATFNFMNEAASESKNTDTVNAAGNAAQGKDFTKKCSGQWVYCGMAVLALTQAVMSLTGAKKSNDTKVATDCTSSYCSGGNNGGIDPATGLPYQTDPATGGILGANTSEDPLIGALQNDVNSQIGALKDKGYSYDAASNSVNTPNHGSVAASNFSSPEGLKGLGMSDREIGEVQKIAADALKSASKFAGSADFDGGGGGSKIKPGPGYDKKDENGFNMNAYLSGLMNKNGKARGVAGLEKNYGLDQIGVSQDNIFKMIHRRYEAKKTSLTP